MVIFFLKTIEQVENFNDKKFQKTFVVSKITFATMSMLQRQYAESHKSYDIVNEYSLAESITFDIIRLVENTLMSDERFHLYSKSALIKRNIDIAVVDVTEYPIQRPKKSFKTQNLY